jgi:hypothetical protein
MATFLNKKEQVYDLKLTSYGRYLLSIGIFKPVYYAFFDDNVIYDLRYTTSSVGAFANTPTEGQNNISRRIKTNTPYLESQVLFRDVEDTLSSLDTTDGGFNSDANPTLTMPAADIYTFESALGDAMIDSENPQAVPAWKLLMMQGNISSSIYRGAGKLTPPLGTSPAHEQAAQKGILLNSQIPQINIDAYYTLKVADSSIDLDPDSARSLVDTAGPFSDGKYIQLKAVDPILYLEEINTQLLTENFDIEVFEVESGSFNDIYRPTLHRRYFERQVPQIENGFMVTETPVANNAQNLTTASVEYYFDVLTDASVDQTIACQGLETFEKGSYYVDFDFDCGETTTTATFYDIYGSVTEPEICQD